MKNFIHTLLLLSILGCQHSTQPQAQGNWNLQFRNAAGNSLRKLFMINANKGWIVGNEGTVLHTRDGGNTWVVQENPAQANLWDVFFINEKRGWACGDKNIILRTSNGGTTWQEHILPSSKRLIVLSVAFSDSNNGWICTNNGELLHSDNGGVNWQPVRKFPLRGGFKMCVVHPQTIFILQGKLYKSFDGGDSWDSTAVSYPKGYTGSDMFFVNPGNGWITTINGTGGTYLNECPVMLSNDAGQNWQPSEFISDMALTCCYFTDRYNGWAGGFNGIYRTFDGGWHWNADLAMQELGTRQIFFADSRHGWMLTWQGDIYTYTAN